MDKQKVADYIVHWLQDYANGAGVKGYIVGISGGIDSALTSTLCALTELDVLLVSMPIRQTKAEYTRAMEHIKDLESKFDNVRSIDIELTESFEAIEKALPQHVLDNFLAMANTRARLRMTTLYALGQADGLLVAGTGNKVEDFGVGFFTKYGDGGVDVSPIADLLKTEVFDIARELGVVDSILEAKPTDGLWEDGRSDEDQIGATYPELEWAMGYEGDGSELDKRHLEVLEIYNKFHRANLHKMKPIPVCEIPTDIKGSSL
ncbi:NAD+ synthase [Lishizhenia tianjinensis]|uniref:NH(3)-dependent NAD(+) synthetase n=1 Tax=Lishizhenia tianjinensis TaxID=477690 RepID=A0A1I7BRX9_9FLAO|nr:NAD(+) synthase [Lishizhenia tianjinensis]SFT89947.1 NAD+ synthase [Lishizhenia tianjinensis]